MRGFETQAPLTYSRDDRNAQTQRTLLIMLTHPQSTPSSLAYAYDPEAFRVQGHALIDQVANALQKSLQQEGPVLPNILPDAKLAQWTQDFCRTGQADFKTLVQSVLDESNHLHHPGYVGHQVSAPLPMAALCDMVGSLLNNGTAVYEMGPVTSAMEKILIQWMAEQIGYAPGADGFFTSGGTLGNLTALLAARQAKAGYDLWHEGSRADEPLSILVTGQSHYSMKRAVQIMGWGENGVIPVPIDGQFKMDIKALDLTYQKAHAQGRKVIAVVGQACSTATGAYDPLSAIADFCEQHNLWFHVDGAHGASALLSQRYKHLLEGVNRADSIIWDAHKMMMMPALVTAVIFKNRSDSYQSFSQKASYLLNGQPEEEWFNLAHRTFECTKSMMALKLYACLSVYGTGIFEDYIDQSHDLTREFAQLIESTPDFELGATPESNIICFRYAPPGVDDLDVLNARIRQQVLEHEAFYLVQTQLPQGLFLRCTLMNVQTNLNHLKQLLTHITEMAFKRS